VRTLSCALFSKSGLNNKGGRRRITVFCLTILQIAIILLQLEITEGAMKLGEKIWYLREVEGALRGLDREMTQQQVVSAIKKELGKTISQSYLSQIERGTRPHLTNPTRMLLARFFKVHPGYLVDDPDGYHKELVSDLRVHEDTLDLWLINGAERFRSDAALSQSLFKVANHHDSRKCLLLLRAILETPDLVDRLLEVFKSEHPELSRSSH
jgi:transcriptional regulator with XRE-family HTH domain